LHKNNKIAINGCPRLFFIIRIEYDYLLPVKNYIKSKHSYGSGLGITFHLY